MVSRPRLRRGHQRGGDAPPFQAGPDRQLALSELEVAVLARSNGRRAFQRLGPTELAELLDGDLNDDAPSSEA